MSRTQIQSLEHLRRLANNTAAPLEVVHLIGVARFTKLVMWCEDEGKWYVDEDESMGYYSDRTLARRTTIPAAIECGTLYAELEDRK